MSPRAMVLCAGLGTRLRPLTEELPKPLVPLGDRSVLAHIAERLRRAGLDSVCINTHHLPDAFTNLDAELGLEVHVVHEPVIRGTAGGLAGARSLLAPAPILLWNGDILADPPIAELLRRAQAEAGLVLAVAPREAGRGTVGIGAEGRVVRLRGEVFGAELTGGDYIGIAGVGARCLAALPEMGCLVGDFALPELRKGGTVSAVAAEGGWSDAGDLQAYLTENLAWLEARGLNAFVAPDAEVSAAVELDRAIVGRGARVTGSGRLARVVVWPGAHAVAPLDGAVVTKRTLVRIAPGAVSA